MTRLLVSALSGALLIAVAFFFAAPGSSSAEEVQIESANFYFCSPSFANDICETTVTAGDTVTWKNVDGLHTVTQCDDSFGVCPLPGGFDSGFLNPDDTFVQTFDTPGTFTYWCEIHPVQMRGRILVEEQATPTPSPAPTGAPDTETPSPSPVTTPAGVPPTGAAPSQGGISLLAAALAALGVTLISASLLTFTKLRRR